MPRLLIVAALLTLAACASAAGTPGAGTPSLAGAYRLAEIDGHALPTASPTESRITIAEGTLQLRDGSYVLALNAGAVDGTPFWRTLHGRYADSGGQLAFTPDADSDGDPVTFVYTMQGGALSLRDPDGHAWLFQRR